MAVCIYRYVKLKRPQCVGSVCTVSAIGIISINQDDLIALSQGASGDPHIDIGAGVFGVVLFFCSGKTLSVPHAFFKFQMQIYAGFTAFGCDIAGTNGEVCLGRCKSKRNTETNHASDFDIHVSHSVDDVVCLILSGPNTGRGDRDRTKVIPDHLHIASAYGGFAVVVVDGSHSIDLLNYFARDDINRISK